MWCKAAHFRAAYGERGQIADTGVFRHALSITESASRKLIALIAEPRKKEIAAVKKSRHAQTA